MTDPFKKDLDDMSLEQLGDVNDVLKRNATAETEAAKAKGGSGTNRLDKSARELSSRQVQVEGEIMDRLTDIHKDRSERAQSLDLSLSATRTDDPEKWASDPSRFDYPGLDTP